MLVTLGQCHVSCNLAAQQSMLMFTESATEPHTEDGVLLGNSAPCQPAEHIVVLVSQVFCHTEVIPGLAGPVWPPAQCLTH